MAHDIFISYSTKDKQTADAICHVLEQNNLKCWIAPRNIPAGKDYAHEIMEGLKSAKIVVLVFSKNSQESIFVNNEIDAAFNNNKPIISFKIDDTMPKERMEFFLKTKHWLEAYPNPESVFETLVRDAFRLCNEEHHNKIMVDGVDYSKLNSNKLTTKRKDLISLILLFTPLYSLSFLHMGYVAKMKEWILLGIIYIIPLFLFNYFIVSGQIFRHAQQLSLSIYLFIIMWVVALIVGIFIFRKEFLARKTVLNIMSPDDELFEDLVEEYSRI